MKFHGYYTLSTKPKIVSFWAGDIDDYACKHFRKAFCVVFCPWYNELGYYLDLAKKYEQAGLQFAFACNEQLLATKLRLAGVSHLMCSSNCYVDEHTFNIQSEPKIYDCVYIAQLKSYKRMELLKDVKAPYLITYCDKPQNNLIEFCPEIAHATYNSTWLPAKDVVRIINQSHCGVALSALEGAMLGSVQYLLCGIPIVSTSSVGGRDRFFDNYHTTIVDAVSSSVAMSVNNLKDNKLDRKLIRQVTLDRMWTDRQALLNLIMTKTGEDESVLAERLFGQGIEKVFTLLSKPA